MNGGMVSIRFIIFGVCGLLGCAQPAPAPEATPTPVSEVVPHNVQNEPADVWADPILTTEGEDSINLDTFAPKEETDSENSALIEDIQTPNPAKPVKHEGPGCKKVSDCHRYPLPKDGSYWKCVDKVCVKGNHFEDAFR